MHRVAPIVGSLLAALALSACSALDVGRLHFNGTADVYPANYRELVRLEPDGREWQEISQPMAMGTGRLVFSPRLWYVCVRSETRLAVYAFEGGGTVGIIPMADAGDGSLCQAAQFETFA